MYQSNDDLTICVKLLYWGFQLVNLINFFLGSQNLIILNIFLKQDNPNLTVIDARPELRFLKIEPEPRKNIGKGNIPKSINYPSTLFDIKGFLKTKTEIKKIFSKIKKISTLFVVVDLE